MKVFVAGATGAIGRRLVPLLLADGHEVVGSTRSEEHARALRASGASPVVMDPLDADSVMRAVGESRPDAIVHELTALSSFKNLKRFDDEFALTNRLRTEGLDHLLAAASAYGTRRVIAQSFTGWPNSRVGGPVKTEADPLDPEPPASMAKSLNAIRYLEDRLTSGELDGTVLRYGSLYGPGTSMGEGGDFPALIRKRQLPIIGDGAGVWSFVHVDDAAAATVAAIGGEMSGVYNIVDDEPAPVSEWLPYLARALGAKPPRHLPARLGRFLVGEAGVAIMTQARGSSNAKAKRDLRWRPCYPSWRSGFWDGLSDAVQPSASVGQSAATVREEQPAWA